MVHSLNDTGGRSSSVISSSSSSSTSRGGSDIADSGWDGELELRELGDGRVSRSSSGGLIMRDSCMFAAQRKDEMKEMMKVGRKDEWVVDSGVTLGQCDLSKSISCPGIYWSRRKCDIY